CERTGELMRAGDDEVSSELRRRLGEVVVEPKMCAPCAINDQSRPVRVGDSCESSDIGGGSEVAWRHHVYALHGSPVLRLGCERVCEHLRCETVRNTVVVVDARCNERGDEAGE